MSDNQIRNKATFERFQHAANSGDAELIATVIDQVAPDVVFHAPVPIDTTGAAALKFVWRTLLRAFPDLHVTVEDVIAEGDKVVYRNTVTGTHLGEYHGMPPTGNAVRYDEIFIVRFDDARIAEIWGVVDVFRQLRQLGALSAIGGGAAR